MNLKKLLGLQSAQEKIEEYKELKERLGKLDTMGQELTDKFMIQKSIIDDITTVPESKRQETFARYNSFLTEHQKEVAVACNERTKILKSMDKLRNDEAVGRACKDIDLLDTAAQRYKDGTISKSVYFDILKSVSGEPTKYADVLAFNKQGQLLILHRVTDFVPNGTVCIPGGHVDPGEDFKTAALRELKEETNLDPITEAGVKELGEYKSDDAHIKYYQVMVDEMQPVTCDATEHCYHEYIDVGTIPLRPFIFDQGENIMKFLMNPDQEIKLEPLLKALDEGRITPEVFVPAFNQIIKKALDTETAKPLIPESMDGSTKTIATPAPTHKAIVPLRDPRKSMEQLMKAISGCTRITVGTDMKFEQPLTIHDVVYKSDPENNRLTEVEILYAGDEVNMRQLLDRMKLGLLNGSMKIRTPHEEFMLANENGTDYVGDAVFVPL